MATQTAEQTAPEPRPASELTIAEMTRIMDVAATLRREQSIAQQQLNLDETRALLRQRLREAADAAGDPVTDAQIDAAIEDYFDNLHEFEPPEPGMQTFLASVYVRRRAVVGVVLAVAAAVALWWGAFAVGVVGPKRAERALDLALADVRATAEAVERQADVPDLAERAAGLLARADQARESSQLAELQSLRVEAAELGREAVARRALLAEEYRVLVVTGDGVQSGVDRYHDGRVSGYYLIVQAVGPGGKVLPREVVDAETGQTRTVTTWAEQVPKEVYDRVAADKLADGVVDQREFATKSRGEAEVKVVMPGAGDAPLPRGRQITQW